MNMSLSPAAKVGISAAAGVAGVAGVYYYKRSAAPWIYALAGAGSYIGVRLALMALEPA